MSAKKMPAVGGSTSAGGCWSDCLNHTSKLSGCQALSIKKIAAEGSRRPASRDTAAIPDSQCKHGVFRAVRGSTPHTNRGVRTNA